MSNFGSELQHIEEFDQITHRVAENANDDIKRFLSGVLRATESSLSELKLMKSRIDELQRSSDEFVALAEREKLITKQSRLRSELEALASSAGAFDAKELVHLIDFNTVQNDLESGKITAETVIKTLRSEKPYLFKMMTTSAVHGIPKPGSSVPKSALEMTLDEYRTAKARLVKSK